MTQIKAVERARDAVVTKKASEDENERMIRDLVGLSGIGVEGATLLVREVFCREFRNRQALGAYAGLTGTPFLSGKMEREQSIGKDGNRRVRSLIVGPACFWRRFRPDSKLSKLFDARVGGARGMIVTLARKFLVALWRYVKDGVVPDGAVMKTA